MVTIRTEHQPPGKKHSSRPLQYPTRDGRPMGESDRHRNEMFAAIESLKMFFEGRKVYVSGNILLFYKPGNRRKHVSPDVMVVHDLGPEERDNYLLWNEKPPNFVIEVSSKSTSKEDLKDKLKIYRDVIGVREYFLFDPRSEYLSPALQGHRLLDGRYVRIAPVEGRLPSVEIGLHLEKREQFLRFYNPKAREWIPTFQEAQLKAERRWAHESGRRVEAEALQRAAEARTQTAQEARRAAEAEVERLKQELADLRHGNG